MSDKLTFYEEKLCIDRFLRQFYINRHVALLVRHIGAFCEYATFFIGRKCT